MILFGVLVNAKPGALAPAGNVVFCLSAFMVIGMLFDPDQSSHGGGGSSHHSVAQLSQLISHGGSS